MKTREVAAIALKVLGVYVFLQFLTLLPTAFGLLEMVNAMRESGGGDFEEAMPYAWMAAWLLFITVLYLALSASAFLGARRLARFFVSDPEDEVTLAGPVSDSLHQLVIQSLGVYALVDWAPPLIQTTAQCIIYGTWTDPQTPFLQRFYDNWVAIVGPLLGVMIGLALVFRAKGLLRLIQLSRPMSQERVNLEMRAEEDDPQ